MRRSPLLVVTAVLALTGITGCSDDSEEKPATPAVAPSAGAAAAAEPTESFDMPPAESELDSPKPPRTDGDPSARAAVPNPVTPSGFGPYSIGELQTDYVESKLIGATTMDAGGCSVGDGTSQYGAPKLYFLQGKLAMVKASAPTAAADPAVKVGTPLADVQAAYPEGKAVTGASGAAGWQVVEETEALLFEFTADKVSAISGGLAASVAKNFTTGSGC